MENQEELVTIKTYYSDAEADFAKNILEANGIKAMVAGRTSMWAGGGTSFSPELKVRRRDTEKALKILEEAKRPIGGNKSVPMIKRKDFLSTLKWVMALLVSILLSLYFVPKFFYLISDSQRQNENEIVNTSTNLIRYWQIYKNEEYGFEIKYPAENKVYSIKNEKYCLFEVDDPLVFIGSREDGDYYGISVGVINDPEKFSPEDWYSQYYSEKKEESEEAGTPFTLTKPEKGTKEKIGNYEFYMIGQWGCGVEYLIYENSFIYNFQYNIDDGTDNNYELHQEIIKLIISTLKFL